MNQCFSWRMICSERCVSLRASDYSGLVPVGSSESAENTRHAASLTMTQPRRPRYCFNGGKKTLFLLHQRTRRSPPSSGTSPALLVNVGSNYYSFLKRVCDFRSRGRSLGGIFQTESERSTLLFMRKSIRS